MTLGSLLLTVNVQGTGPEAAEARGAPLFGRFAHGGYAARIGLTRLLDAFRDRGMAAAEVVTAERPEDLHAGGRLGARVELCCWLGRYRSSPQ